MDASLTTVGWAVLHQTGDVIQHRDFAGRASEDNRGIVRVGQRVCDSRHFVRLPQFAFGAGAGMKADDSVLCRDAEGCQTHLGFVLCARTQRQFQLAVTGMSWFSQAEAKRIFRVNACSCVKSRLRVRKGATPLLA